MDRFELTMNWCLCHCAGSLINQLNVISKDNLRVAEKKYLWMHLVDWYRHVTNLSIFTLLSLGSALIPVVILYKEFLYNSSCKHYHKDYKTFSYKLEWASYFCQRDLLVESKDNKSSSIINIKKGTEKNFSSFNWTRMLTLTLRNKENVTSRMSFYFYIKSEEKKIIRVIKNEKLFVLIFDILFCLIIFMFN